MWSNRNSHSLLVGMQTDTASLKTVSYKTKYILTILSSYHNPWYFYSKELKIYIHRKPCTQMFIEALCIVARTWG